MSFAIFIPVRKGSERVPEKNTRNFSDYEYGLIELKLNQLEDFNLVNEIILSTNDEKCLQIAQRFSNKISNLKIDHRPDHLGRADTDLTDLIKYVPGISNCEHFLWTHVTSPFCEKENYAQAIEKYKELEGFDSLMTGSLFQEFLWNKDKKEIVNNLTGKAWPRTQDLQKNFLIDNAIFVAHRKFYEKGKRIGLNPYLWNWIKLLHGILIPTPILKWQNYFMKDFSDKEVIFWDFDGVIIDSEKVRTAGFEKVLRDYPKEEVEQLIQYHKKNGGLSRYVKFRYFFEEIRKSPISDERVDELSQ